MASPAASRDEARVASTLVELAKFQLTSLQAQSARLDSVAVGFLGFKGALIAVVFAAGQTGLGPAWHAPIPGLVVSLIFDIAVLFASGTVNLGPNPRSIYQLYGRDELAANRQLLADLSTALDEQSRHPVTKRAALTLSIVSLLATALYSAIWLPLAA